MTLHSGPEPSLALTLLLPERQRVSPRCWGVGGAESCASPTPPSALAAPPPPSEGQGLLRLSWLGLDAISAAEQGSLAGSNFLIRTPGLPARLLVLSPYSPPAKPHPTGLPTDHSHAQGTTRVQVGGTKRGHHSGTGCRRGAGAKPPHPAAGAQVKVKAPHPAPRRLFQTSAPSLPATKSGSPTPGTRGQAGVTRA